jgi:hypothetical protein
MQATLEEARYRGYQTIWLSSWEKNDRANAFYKRWKFKIVGSHKFIVGSEVQNDFILSRIVQRFYEIPVFPFPNAKHLTQFFPNPKSEIGNPAYCPLCRLTVTDSPPIPQLSVSTSSMTTTVVCGFLPKVSCSSRVTPAINSAFWPGVAPSLVILMLTKGILVSSFDVRVLHSLSSITNLKSD